MFKKIVKYKAVRTILRIFNFFFNDDINYYAASLSFFTIFSILPIIALLISIISNLPEFDKYLVVFTDFLLKILNPIHSKLFIEQAMQFIENSDKLGFIGTIYMIFVFTMFFRDYEHVVNKIHQTESRPLYKAFLLYFGLAIIVPILFVVYFFIKSLFENIIFSFFVSFIFAWFIFFSLFKFTINKAINHKSAIISSFVTVFSLGIMQNLFLQYVLYNQTYATLYGSLSALLFFFLWLYISWIIYLFGIKLCHNLNS